MPPREDDDVAPRPDGFPARRLLMPVGFALAVAASLAVFLTDNPQYLRIAVVAVAWAFVLAAFAAGRRGTDRVAAAAREAQLRQAYEHELDREAAARREYELDLEHQLRREAEESMRYELDALRGDIASLSGLRDEVARVSELRGDIAALSGLRDDVARVAALGDDVAALTALRQDLGQLEELRAEMGRMRAELTEQLSSEMLVERIVMRTQASRLTTEPGRLDGGPARSLEGSWSDDVPPRELTGGWPAVRLDEPRETRQFDEVRIERSAHRPPVPAAEHRPWEPAPAEHRPWEPAPAERRPWEPAPAERRPWEPAAAESRPWDAPLPTRWDTPAVGEAPSTSAWQMTSSTTAAEESRYRYVVDEPLGPPPTTMSPIAPSSIARPPAPESRPAVPPQPVWESPARRPTAPDVQDVRRPLDRPPVPPPVASPPPSPIDWLAARSLLDAPSPAARPEAPRTAYHPAAPPPVRSDDRAGQDAPVRDGFPATAPGAAREKRLADILAENGVSPTSGGRRRRRYRDEGEPDDVLARVLGQG